MSLNPEPIHIAGAGMAGSLLALLLGRAGYGVVVFEPRRDPLPAFRIEKLDGVQIEALSRLGVLDCFSSVCWPASCDRHAYADDARPALVDAGARYADWVASLQAAWPATVRRVQATVDGVERAAAGPCVLTRDGGRWPARLLVVATGRSTALTDTLGVERRVVSAGHSVCLGFSVARSEATPARILQAPFGTGLAYVSLFPAPGEIRVNVFSHRPLGDPWHRRMSGDPIAALLELAPEAGALLHGREVVRRCEARVTDLYQTHGHERVAGTVLIGDAFHAPCPGSGTGLTRILNDVELLAATYVPAWMTAPTIRVQEIARFYGDPRKRTLDRASLRRSLRGRRHALDTGAYWRLRRGLHSVRNAVRPS